MMLEYYLDLQVQCALFRQNMNKSVFEPAIEADGQFVVEEIHFSLASMRQTPSLVQPFTPPVTTLPGFFAMTLILPLT